MTSAQNWNRYKNLMGTTTETVRYRLGWIGMLELVMFLLSCFVHYFAYKSRGSLPFPSDLEVLFFLSWFGIAVIMLFASRALKANAEVPPGKIMIVILIYAALTVWWIAGTIPMLLNDKIPLLVKAAGVLPWLLLRGWFLWLLLDGALKQVREEKVKAVKAAATGPTTYEN